MAVVYILFSKSISKYYIGSCLNLKQRLLEHSNKVFDRSYTKRASDWELFYCILNLERELARKIESHIKNMRSKLYIENLKKYPEIIKKLKQKYSLGSSR